MVQIVSHYSVKKTTWPLLRKHQPWAFLTVALLHTTCFILIVPTVVNFTALFHTAGQSERPATKNNGSGLRILKSRKS
ncbi:hypothetical protein WR25_12895 [Diploscapter pachys]|uniref:Uncharacterized protein n=1 Tax=Diploscapter pachys TaxID=2018661 RepID=A0A2A2LFL3_9BILA|nr:hypothetical protein WR25_12895 [Diploscapter pachys]